MSRVGKSPIYFGDKVTVSVNPQNEVVVQGPKVSQKVKMHADIIAELQQNTVVLKRKDETRNLRALHGLYRSLIQNAVIGVEKGWSKTLELKGIGYRAAIGGKKLELSLGYSHPIVYEIPDGIDIKIDKQTTIHVNGANKELVGQVAATIRDFRKPEPYLGKGVRYLNEKVRQKAGKSSGK